MFYGSDGLDGATIQAIVFCGILTNLLLMFENSRSCKKRTSQYLAAIGSEVALNLKVERKEKGTKGTFLLESRRATLASYLEKELRYVANNPVGKFSNLAPENVFHCCC